MISKLIEKFLSDNERGRTILASLGLISALIMSIGMMIINYMFK